jgi:eukaryotic-like serine/threonine-protein kinase
VDTCIATSAPQIDLTANLTPNSWGTMTPSQRPIANRYQLIRQLASGSYAETWLATDVMLDRYVAVKLLHPSETNEHKETAQFLREARIAAAVNHSNIVAIFDAGSTGERPYLVMEWVDGTSLKQEITSARRISVDRAITVVSELLGGLSAIHAQGIIHRDVKPQNIMVNEFGTVKLTDFGIARLTSEVDGGNEGITAGTAAYMAPEQAQGLPVTPRSDVYAAGIILYEMLTGRLPFTHEDPQHVMMQHISDSVIRPRRINPSIPTGVEAIVLKALEKDPAERFQSADEMRTALRSARSYLPVRRPVAVAERMDETQGALPRFALMSASIAFIVVLLAGATTFAVRDLGATDTVADEPEPTVTATATAVPTEEPAVELEPTSTPAPPPTEPEPSYAQDYDEYAVRGEVVIDGIPETPSGVNRPAPGRLVSDDEVEEEEPAPQAVAAPAPTQPPAPQPAPTQPPAPQPTPAPPPPTTTPEPEEPADQEEPDQSDEPSEVDIDEAEADDTDSEPADPGEGEVENSGDEQSEDEQDTNANGNSIADENSEHNGTGGGNPDEDAPVSNQAHDDDQAENEQSEEDATTHQPDDEDAQVEEDDEDVMAQPQGNSSSDDGVEISSTSNRNTEPDRDDRENTSERDTDAKTNRNSNDATDRNSRTSDDKSEGDADTKNSDRNSRESDDESERDDDKTTVRNLITDQRSEREETDENDENSSGEDSDRDGLTNDDKSDQDTDTKNSDDDSERDNDTKNERTLDRDRDKDDKENKRNSDRNSNQTTDDDDEDRSDEESDRDSDKKDERKSDRKSDRDSDKDDSDTKSDRDSDKVENKKERNSDRESEGDDEDKKQNVKPDREKKNEDRIVEQDEDDLDETDDDQVRYEVARLTEALESA